jgi:hypothetical protein
LEKLAPALLWRSPRALDPFGSGYRVFTFPSPRGIVIGSRVPLMGFGSSSEAAQAPSRCLGALVFQRPDARPEPDATGSSSLEVSAPSAFSRAGQRHELVGPAFPDRLRLQVFSTSWRLHPPRACRPCFMPDPLLGSPSRAFFLGRSRALLPAPFPSWRPIRLQGLAPRPSPPLGSGV